MACTHDLPHPSAKLSRSGRGFLRDLQRSQPGVSSPYWAQYAAQATEVLLAAITRSDGTRASIARELSPPGSPKDPPARRRSTKTATSSPNASPCTALTADTRGDPLLPPDLHGASIGRIVTPPPDYSATPLNNDHVG